MEGNSSKLSVASRVQSPSEPRPPMATRDIEGEGLPKPGASLSSLHDSRATAQGSGTRDGSSTACQGNMRPASGKQCE